MKKVRIDLEVLEKEESLLEEGKRVGEIESRLYYLEPRESGLVGVNRLFVLAFRPARMRLWEGVYPAEQWDYKVVIKGHWWTYEDEETGNEVTKLILCPEGQGAYYAQLFGSRVLEKFNWKCAFCRESERWWSKFNDRKEKLGMRGRIDSEEYRRVVEKDEELRLYKENARRFQVSERFAFVVIGLPAVGVIENVNEVRHKILFAPREIERKLFLKVKAGYHFYDFENLMVVDIIKDTREGVMRSKYDVEIEPREVRLKKDVLEAICDEERVPDISDFVEVWTYKDVLDVLGGEYGLEEKIEKEVGKTVGGVGVKTSVEGRMEERGKEEVGRGEIKKEEIRKEEKVSEEVGREVSVNGLKKKRKIVL